MAIEIENAPGDLLDVVASGLAALPVVAGGLEGAEGAQLYQPLPLNSAPTRAISHSGDDRPPLLERVGWRVLVDEGPTLAIAEVRSTGEGAALTALWRGVVADLLAGASLAAEEALVGERVYHARVIALPEIGLEALWLHGGLDDDMVVPLLEKDGQPSSFHTLVAEARRRANAITAPRNHDEATSKG